MRATLGPQRLTVLELNPGADPLRVFRIVRSDHADDPVLLNSLRSHYELSEPPRRVERSSTVIHMGISTYISFERARDTSRRWPRIGEYVAELALEHGFGFNYAHTGHVGHLTVWGDPVKLLATVVDIRPAED